MFLSRLAPSKFTLGFQRGRLDLTDVNAYGRQPGERVLNEMPFALWVARAPDGEVIYTNRALRAILGIEAGDGSAGASDEGSAAAASATQFFDRQGHVYPHERLPFSRALASGEPVVADDLVIRREGAPPVYLRAFANPVFDGEGAISHVVVAFTDITEEVRADVARADVEEHLEAAVHDAPVLLFILDRAGILTAADGALRPVLELGKGGPVVGVSMLEAYKDHATVVDNVRRALAGETVSYSFEVRGLTLDVWLGPLRDAAGELVGAIGVCTDVTETRRLQTNVIQHDRIRAMGTIAASVAHEINNPLTYVLAGLEESAGEIDRLVEQLGGLARANGNGAVATMALEGIGRVQEHLIPVLAGTRRIRDVARALRTFTRPDDERLARIDVAEVVRAVLKLVGKEIEARARLVEEVDTSPPILANEARLVQVLTNLFINAWQAIPDPDPARHVVGVRTGTEGTSALIEIWDSGPGVPAHLREQIFEPFGTTNAVGAGSGLGLFVCRDIINSLNGRITVGDRAGGGALFRIVLPAAAPTEAVAPAPVPALRDDARARRRRVLIIDDDAMVADALGSRFADDSFEVRTVLDGRQGLEILLADEGLDLAYCDVMMKGFGGIDLYEALRRQAPKRLSKVVFMSGGAFTEEARVFLGQREGDCVQKPFDIVADARRRLGEVEVGARPPTDR